MIPPHRSLPAFSFATVNNSFQQGKELKRIIDRVKKTNRVQKVILVGHSMGGLAAREYLQSEFYAEDVAGYVSVGTPHQGSNFDLKKVALKFTPKIFKNLYWDIDASSDAVRDLRPHSIYLEGGSENDSPKIFKNKDINLNGVKDDHIVGLNNFQKKPLPEDVVYASVIGSGCPIVATRKQCILSDGIVRIQSQDLNQVPGVNIVASVYYTEKDHFGEANDSLVIINAIAGFLIPVN